MNTEQIDQVVARLPRAKYPNLKFSPGAVGVFRRTWDQATATQCRHLVEQGLVITGEDAPHTEHCDKCLEGTDMPDCPLSLRKQVMCARRQGWVKLPGGQEMMILLRRMREEPKSVSIIDEDMEAEAHWLLKQLERLGGDIR